jgi:hypothetical protein
VDQGETQCRIVTSNSPNMSVADLQTLLIVYKCTRRKILKADSDASYYHSYCRLVSQAVGQTLTEIAVDTKSHMAFSTSLPVCLTLCERSCCTFSNEPCHSTRLHSEHFFLSLKILLAMPLLPYMPLKDWRVTCPASLASTAPRPRVPRCVSRWM